MTVPDATLHRGIDLIAVQRATTLQWPCPELTGEKQRYAGREMTAAGWSTQEIADRLGVADRTVIRCRGGGS